MNLFKGFVSSVSGLYKDINPATLSGAIDVVVVEDSSGNLCCSPFHVRFGKFKVFKTQDKAVNVSVNGSFAKEIQMKLGEAGEAFFVQETTESIPMEFQTSPLIRPVDSNLEDESQKSALEPSKLELGNALSDSELMESSDKKASFLGKESEFPSNELVSGNLSDSEMLQQQSCTISSSSSPTFSLSSKSASMTATTSAPSTANKWDWEWGDFPHKEEITPTVSLSVPVSPLPSFDSPPPASLSTTTTASEKPNQFKNDFSQSPKGEYFIKLLLEEEYFASSCAYFHQHLDQIVSGKCLVSACALAQIHKPEATEEAFLKHLKATDNSPNVPTMMQELFNDNNLVVKLGHFYLPAQAVFVLITGRMFGKKQFSLADFAKIAQDCRKSCQESFGIEFQPDSSSKQVKPKDSASSSKNDKPFSKFWKNSPNSSTSASANRPAESNSPVPLSDSESDVPPRSPTPIRFQKQPLVLKAPKISYLKTLRLTSSQLKSLNLHPGENNAKFSLSSNPSINCSAKIFLWKESAKIIISDIDGTITKSDALGHLFAFMGKDWTHAGVANLFSLIQKNGYHFLYLTSRALGQASSTREYLSGVDQNQCQLPIGPVIMSPDRLFTAFHREIILKRPEEFKIIALKDIKRLFKVKSPFFAGFGNRQTDVVSYRAVEIPASKIFVINPVGNVSVNNLSIFFTTSYTKLVSLVEQIFPPLDEHAASDEEESFNDFHYWRQKIPSLQSLERSLERHSISSGSTLKSNASHLQKQLESDEEEEEEPFL